MRRLTVKEEIELNSIWRIKDKKIAVEKLVAKYGIEKEDAISLYYKEPPRRWLEELLNKN
uniref:Uncharacterized protein n=1 Tax=viral metagenome TaxID=1070528 RepID=A0A6H1ZEP9_9ZZZZ